MKVSVSKENVVITEGARINEGEFRVNKCSFQLPECFEGLSVTAAFDNIPVPLFGNECYVPSLKKGTSTLGVYAYRETEDGLEIMYSPKPTQFYVDCGSYTEDTRNEETPQISQFEKYCDEIASLSIPKSSIVRSFNIEEDVSDEQIYSASAVHEFAGIVEQELVNAHSEIAKSLDTHESFKSDIEKRINSAEKEMSGLSNSLSGEKSAYGSLIISDVSPVKHMISIDLSSENASKLSYAGVTVCGRNIFGLDGRVPMSFGDASSTALRQFSGNGIFVGVSGSNYYSAGKVNYTYDTSTDIITMDCMKGWYGVGIDVPVKAGEVYTVSMLSSNVNARVVLAFYTEQGEHISFVQGTKYTATVPSNACWMLCVLASSQESYGVVFENVQIERGTKATEFCRYTHPRRMFADSNGNVPDVESIYPETRIDVDDKDVCVSVKYSRDINAAFNELRNALVKLGGLI